MIGALAVLLWAIAVVRLAGVRTHRPSPGAATLTVTFLLLAVATTLRWASGPPPAPGVAPNLPGIVSYVFMLAAAAAIVMLLNFLDHPHDENWSWVPVAAIAPASLIGAVLLSGMVGWAAGRPWGAGVAQAGVVGYFAFTGAVMVITSVWATVHAFTWSRQDRPMSWAVVLVALGGLAITVSCVTGLVRALAELGGGVPHLVAMWSDPVFVLGAVGIVLGVFLLRGLPAVEADRQSFRRYRRVVPLWRLLAARQPERTIGGSARWPAVVRRVGQRHLRAEVEIADLLRAVRVPSAPGSGIDALAADLLSGADGDTLAIDVLPEQNLSVMRQLADAAARGRR